jgi:hypothetical protein
MKMPRINNDIIMQKIYEKINEGKTLERAQTIVALEFKKIRTTTLSSLAKSLFTYTVQRGLYQQDRDLMEQIGLYTKPEWRRKEREKLEVEVTKKRTMNYKSRQESTINDKIDTDETEDIDETDPDIQRLQSRIKKHEGVPLVSHNRYTPHRKVPRAYNPEVDLFILDIAKIRKPPYEILRTVAGKKLEVIVSGDGDLEAFRKHFESALKLSNIEMDFKYSFTNQTFVAEPLISLYDPRRLNIQNFFIAYAETIREKSKKVPQHDKNS